MKANIIYIESHTKSNEAANNCLQSCEKFGIIDAELVSGITPASLSYFEELYRIKPVVNSRAYAYETEQQPMYHTKKSCFFNHVLFWEKVVDKNEPMIFLEHDAVCIREYDYPDFDEVLVLNLDAAFRHNKNLWKKHAYSYIYKDEQSAVRPLVSSLKYWKENKFKGGYLIPGTAAYAITPKGATRLLESTRMEGWDQSDFFINTKNVNIEYADPQYFAFSGPNMSTSKGFK